MTLEELVTEAWRIKLITTKCWIFKQDYKDN